MQILNSQKSLLYDLIEQQGLLPSAFSLEDVQSSVNGHYSTIIKHEIGNYFFSINSTALFYYEYSPGDIKLIQTGQTTNWIAVTVVFLKWLETLQREITTVDKWQKLREGLPNISFTNIQGQFTYNEVLEIESKILVLKSEIRQIPLTTLQVATLNEKLDYCIELAKSANKFDWGSYFLGVITNVILNLSVTPDNAHAIWIAVKHAFHGFLLT